MLNQQELPLDRDSQERRSLTKRLGVYRVELVRDRSVTYEPDAAMSALTTAVNIIQQELQRADRERLLCLWLNARHDLIGMEVVSVGTLTASLAHPREIFKGAILKNAAGIILAHNHPSGDPNPSDEDRRLTRRLAEAGRVIGIDILDHVIVADKTFYSFKTQGVL
jgi:DNA repair protein RadC